MLCIDWLYILCPCQRGCINCLAQNKKPSHDGDPNTETAPLKAKMKPETLAVRDTCHEHKMLTVWFWLIYTSAELHDNTWWFVGTSLMQSLFFIFFSCMFLLRYYKIRKKNTKHILSFFFNEAENITRLIPKNCYNMKKVVLYFHHEGMCEWWGWMRGRTTEQFTWNRIELLQPPHPNLAADH